MTTLYQLHFTAARGLIEESAALLENSLPEPLSVSIFEVEGDIWGLNAHYSVPPDITATRRHLACTLEQPEAAFPLSMEPLADKDWVSHVQKNLKPVEAGRFLIHGEHDREKASGHNYAIEINAAQAFGTAHHGTTMGCLIAIDQLSAMSTPASILDLGTGTGILAIAAHMVWPKAAIIATDIDPIAVEIAAANAAHNLAPALTGSERGGPITFICADGLDHPALMAASPFDLLIANILAKPLIEMAVPLTGAIKPGGRALLSGILDDQAADVIRAFQAAGLCHNSTDQHGEWVTIQFEKIDG